MIQNDRPWEGDVVEGPWFVIRNGWYYLFYSAQGYCGPEYAVAVARSRDPHGPYEKYPNPIYRTNGW